MTALFPIPILLTIVVLLFLLSGCAVHNKSLQEEGWSYQKHRADQSNFSSSDGKLSYLDKGEGSVVLLLHGVPTSSWLYRKMVDDLVAGGHRVIAPDMLGFGNSDSPKGYDVYSAPAHAKRLLELMDHLQIPNWAHVLHDAGGFWTWELLKIAPERVSHLVILNTLIYEEGFHPPVRMKPGFIAKTSMWMYRNGVTTNFLLKQLFKVGLSENNMTKGGVEGYKKPLREGKTRGMYYFFTQTKSPFPDYRDLLQNLSVPAIVVWGSEDSMLQWEPQQNEVTTDLKIKQEDVHLLDVSHFIQEENPKEVSRQILEFLRR